MSRYFTVLLLLTLTACSPAKPDPTANAATPPPPKKKADIFEAARTGNMVRLQELVMMDSGCVTNLQPSYGRTALHAAITANQKDAVGLLIDSKSDIEARDRSHRTPLQNAVQLKNQDIALLLLSRGASTEGTTKDKETLLRNVVKRGHTRVLQILFNRGLDPKTRIGLNNMLNAAAAEGHADMVELMLKRGCPINDKGNSGTTPLQAAAKAGKFEIVKLLLSNRADIDGGNYSPNHGGTTPLVAAVLSGHNDVAMYLIEHGARFQPTRNGRNLLHLAAGKGSEPVVALLIRKGMNPRAVDSGNTTALHAAAKGGSVDAARLLLSHQVGVNAIDRRKNSALSYACEKGHEKVVAFLLEKGADPNAANQLGATPLHYAALQNHVGMTKVLLEYGASPAARLAKNVQITESVHGYVNPFAHGKNVTGQTPVEIARSAEVKKLLAKGPTGRPKVARTPVAKPVTRQSEPAPATPRPAAARSHESFVGRPVSEVTKTLGKPKMTAKRGKGIILLYPNRKISSSDGITVDKDTAR